MFTFDHAKNFPEILFVFVIMLFSIKKKMKISMKQSIYQYLW